MTSKEYLQQIRKTNILINYKQKQLDELKQLTESITAAMNPNKVQSSGSQDKIGDTVSKIVDLQDEINQEIDRLVDLKRDIMKTIDKLEHAEHVELLYKRYFEFKTWEQIAVEMGFSCQWIWVLHGEALKKISEILKV